MSEETLVATACWPCVCGLHNECFEPSLTENDDEAGGVGWQCCCYSSREPDAVQFVDGLRGGEVAGVEELTSTLSTGRKRAAMVAPIFPGMLCEWAGLRYAGGGVMPIVGCRGNRIADVKRNADLPENADARGELHHGPDKSTLNNAPGLNLHRICASCHKHWHALNDRYYGERPGPAEQFLPLPDAGEVHRHDYLTKATENELDQSEIWWGIRTEQRPDYPFAAPVR